MSGRNKKEASCSTASQAVSHLNSRSLRLVCGAGTSFAKVAKQY